jgi:hypothetical protein
MLYEPEDDETQSYFSTRDEIANFVQRRRYKFIKMILAGLVSSTMILVIAITLIVLLAVYH